MEIEGSLLLVGLYSVSAITQEPNKNPIAFLERQQGSHWAPELLLRLGTVRQVIGFLLYPRVDFLRGESL